LALAPVALRAPSAKANTEQQITCLQGGANSDHQKGPNQVDETSVQRDYSEAYFWLAVASAGKAPETVAGIRATERDAAAVYLTRAELSRVRERAQKWIEDHPSKPQ
jgi:hypothetical protein